MLSQELTNSDTICAIATAVGGAVAIIRLSGPEAVAIADGLWRGRHPLAETPPRHLAFGSLAEEGGAVYDAQCLAVRMPGPHSYTGEDIVEFQCHGGAVNIRMALEALLRRGARLAEPGEFTRRSFLNGKLDLTQAEAVADLVSAGSAAALALANRQLDGALGREIDRLHQEIRRHLADAEARLDFPEEELDFLPPETEAAQIGGLAARLEALAAGRQEGEILRGGVSLAIAGAPNVGKSSLLNAILGQDRAIVSSIPGTTRDTIEAQASIRGIPVRLTDTAGIRRSRDPIEQTGVRRAEKCAGEADVVLWLVDPTIPEERQIPPPADGRFRGALLLVSSKNDLLPPGTKTPGIPVSCVAPHGLERLFDALEDAVWRGRRSRQDEIAVGTRHARLLERAAAALRESLPWIRQEAWELAAIPLRDALEQLGRITGRTFSPDLLGEIFSRFCIGK